MRAGIRFAKKRQGKQQGVALLFVIIIIFSLALLLPSSFRQLAQGYDLVSLEVEKQRALMKLASVLDFTIEQADIMVNGNKEDKVNYICNRQKTAPISAKSGGYYQVSIRCERRKRDYLITAEGLLVQAGMTRRFTLDRSL